jgi:acetyltransferase-like isoleucine patch superfamily enzyme|tara:strand:+ start:1282 stop:1950 length:669 start_codon:yes stop_codon:yes gene_type:complete
MKKILSILIVFFPWVIRRWLLIKIWKYEIHSTAKIGFSYINPRNLRMEKNSYIGNFNVAINLDQVVLGESSTIIRLNWITGFPTKTSSRHFRHQKNRRSELIIGCNSAITKNHHIDCTNQIVIGNFVTIAGYYSQFLTHSINIEKNIQDSKPINIGDYTFIGTNSVLLGGANLPAYSVLGAKGLLNKYYTEEYTLYGGVPANPISLISRDAKYFKREKGFVY